jgi:hypothetical protein
LLDVISPIHNVIKTMMATNAAMVLYIVKEETVLLFSFFNRVLMIGIKERRIAIDKIKSNCGENEYSVVE